MIELVVMGKKIEIDIDKELYLPSRYTDFDTVAAEIAYWGNILAQAIEERIMAETSWRKRRGELVCFFLSEEPKLAEWKVKGKIECTDDFILYKKGIAKAYYNETMAESIYKAYIEKAKLIETKMKKGV
jgi:hypothetical protein